MNKQTGFVALIGILLVVLIIAFLWWKYDFSFSVTKTTTTYIEEENLAPSRDTYIEHNLNAIDKAKDAKKLLEERSFEYEL